MATKKRKRSSPVIKKLRLLQTIRDREKKGLEPPATHWFNGGQLALLRSLLKGGYIVNGDKGVRLTARGRALVTPSAHDGENDHTGIADEKTRDKP